MKTVISIAVGPLTENKRTVMASDEKRIYVFSFEAG
jgi:hypothetical protein